MNALASQSIRLQDAKLCIDCKVIHDGTQCPKCGISVHLGHLILSTILDRTQHDDKQLVFCPKCAWREYASNAVVALREHQRTDCPFRTGNKA